MMGFFIEQAWKNKIIENKTPAQFHFLFTTGQILVSTAIPNDEKIMSLGEECVGNIWLEKTQPQKRSGICALAW